MLSFSDSDRSKKADGIQCIRCGCRHCPVVYTRHRNGHTYRQRECRHCGRRFITKESPSGK